jgi:hypothetical protein
MTNQSQPSAPSASPADPIKRSDQIALLEACAHFTDTGEWRALFTYPECGWNLVQLGLATEDRKITPAGRFALWVLDKGGDPLPAVQSFVSFNLPARVKDAAHG